MELSPAWWGTPAIQVLRRQKQENHGWLEVYTASPAPRYPETLGGGAARVFPWLFTRLLTFNNIAS